MEGIQLPVGEQNVHNNETFQDFKNRVYNFSVQVQKNRTVNETEKAINNSLHFVTNLQFRVNRIRLDPNYKLVYINIAQNLVTGVIPLVLLGILNFYVYLHLRKRRKEVALLTKGNFPKYTICLDEML